MPLTGSDRFSLTGWIRDLTYAEIHAVAFGLIHGVMIVATFAIGVPTIAAGLIATALVLTGYLRKDQTATFPVVSTILGAIPTPIRGQLRNEQHYYLSTLIASSVLSASVYIGDRIGLIPGL